MTIANEFRAFTTRLGHPAVLTKAVEGYFGGTIYSEATALLGAGGYTTPGLWTTAELFGVAKQAAYELATDKMPDIADVARSLSLDRMTLDRIVEPVGGQGKRKSGEMEPVLPSRSLKPTLNKRRSLEVDIKRDRRRDDEDVEPSKDDRME